MAPRRLNHCEQELFFAPSYAKRVLFGECADYLAVYEKLRALWARNPKRAGARGGENKRLEDAPERRNGYCLVAAICALHLFPSA